jgi:hypothetical protein
VSASRPYIFFEAPPGLDTISNHRRSIRLYHNPSCLLVFFAPLAFSSDPSIVLCYIHNSSRHLHKLDSMHWCIHFSTNTAALEIVHRATRPTYLLAGSSTSFFCGSSILPRNSLVFTPATTIRVFTAAGISVASANCFRSAAHPDCHYKVRLQSSINRSWEIAALRYYLYLDGNERYVEHILQESALLMGITETNPTAINSHNSDDVGWWEEALFGTDELHCGRNRTLYWLLDKILRHKMGSYWVIKNRHER